MRLDKFLAHAGVGTRNEVKKLIRAKAVKVNGELCKKEDVHIDEDHDLVMVHDEIIYYEKFRYYMLNKPQGVISSTEVGPQKTVLDCLDENIQDLFPVGRLDIDTEGLLLITNDGQLAHELLSPKKHVEKCYYVEISKPLSSEHIQSLTSGITIDGNELCKPAKVEIINDRSLYLYITEGKFHQVKRMMVACNSEVTYLKRISMGSLVLDESLELGEYRPCTEEEISNLRQK